MFVYGSRSCCFLVSGNRSCCVVVFEYRLFFVRSLTFDFVLFVFDNSFQLLGSPTTGCAFSLVVEIRMCLIFVSRA